MNLPVPPIRRSLLLVSLASLGWAFSFGLGAPLASLWLKDAGCSARTIGLNTSLYYLGVALAAPFVPWLMRRANRNCVLVGMLIDAVTTAVFPLVSGLFAWHLLRLVGGVGTAMSLIPMETLVNHDAPADHRARDFGVYAFCVALGITLGSVVGLPLYPLLPQLAFGIGGLVTLLAIILAWLVVPAKHDHVEDEATATPPWRAGLLSLGTAWAQGFVEGGSITFLSIYFLARGHAEAVVSVLMGALFTGVILAQLPVAWLADRLGRLGILLVCHAILCVGLLWAPSVQSTVPLACWLVVLGACCGALYPLGLAFLGEQMPPAAMARANAWYLACNCAGSLSGPVLLGLAIDAFGLRAQFLLEAAAILVVVALWLSTRRWGASGSGLDRSAVRLAEPEHRRAA